MNEQKMPINYSCLQPFIHKAAWRIITGSAIPPRPQLTFMMLFVFWIHGIHAILDVPAFGYLGKLVVSREWRRAG